MTEIIQDAPPSLPPGTDDVAPLRQSAVWLASYPKSGNTWVRIFLHNLARVLLGDGSTAHDLNHLHELTRRESFALHYEKRMASDDQDITPELIAKTRLQVQEDLVRGQAPPVFIKTHNAVATVEGYANVNFDITLAAIYIVRNPLDVTVSYSHFSGRTLDEMIAFMADPDSRLMSSKQHVYEFMGSWSFHVASWLSVPHRPVLVLRYEDMLASPGRTFGRLAHFVGLRPNEEQLQKAIEWSSFDSVARQEEANGFVERPERMERFFRAGRAEQWREALTAKQVRAVVAAHAPMMMRFGYLKEDAGVAGALL